MQKSLGLLLILAAFALGYFGVKNLNDKEAEVKIGEIEISAQSDEGKTQGYALLGGAALCLVVGAVLIARKPKT